MIQHHRIALAFSGIILMLSSLWGTAFFYRNYVDWIINANIAKAP